MRFDACSSLQDCEGMSVSSDRDNMGHCVASVTDAMRLTARPVV